MSFVNGGIADEIRLESDEDGFELKIESQYGVYTFNVQGLAHFGVLAAQLRKIADETEAWWSEGYEAARAHERDLIGRVGSITERETGYDLDDPKHPTYHERMTS